MPETPADVVKGLGGAEIEVRPVRYTAGGVEWATEERATCYGVYLGRPGRFEWQKDLSTKVEALAFAQGLGHALNVTTIEYREV